MGSKGQPVSAANYANAALATLCTQLIPQM